MLKKASGDTDNWLSFSRLQRFRQMKKQSMAVSAFTKFFVAQHSMFYFQFESPFEWARQMVHEFVHVVPMALEEFEKMSKYMGGVLSSRHLQAHLQAH